MGASEEGKEKQKTTLVNRAKAQLERAMVARGWSSHTRRLVWHYLVLLWQQLAAMLPITMLQVLVLAIFFRQTTPTPALEAAGLISAVIGLVLFLDGLRVAIMPMALLVGTQLPKRLKLPWVLLVAFCLGVLVTYAEPAIAAIRPLAALVDPHTAPYLYYMMNQQQEIMVFAIGTGVGVAAVIGTLKFLYGISLKILIAAALLPTIGAACYMQWGNRHLQPLLGVAWDCGAVTTGPVTVPVLLSLGVGVMSAQKEKRLALAVLEDAAVNKSEGNTLEGFGIVTLASLLPILAVELMAIITSLIHPYDYVLGEAKKSWSAMQTQELPLADKSPIKEVVYGVRAISPLLVALSLLVVAVLRQPLPTKGFLVDEEEEKAAGEGKPGAETEDGSDKDIREALDGSNEGHNCKQGKDIEQGKDQVEEYNQPAGQKRRRRLQGSPSFVRRTPSVAEAIVVVAGAEDANYYDISMADGASSDNALLDGDSTPRRMDGVMACLSKYSSLLAAMMMCQIGMILFNIGLTYGFAALGDMTGITLPAAFISVPYEPKSPYYSYGGGVAITVATIFLLGILATKAEPALNVLGQTVETLSGGKFTKKALIWAVCFGVAVGMCAGACKILFQLPLIYFILVKYAVACGLTAAARESITAVAWDSAGVTTGPVTVPFVLSIGIGFSKAVGAPEGFGMLTVMSVAPIISVLLTSLVKRPVKQAVVVASAGIEKAVAATTAGIEKAVATTTELAKVSKLGLQKVSQSLQTRSRTGDAPEPVDFAAQLRADPAMMAQANVTGQQLDQVDRPKPLQRIGEHSLVDRDTPKH